MFNQCFLFDQDAAYRIEVGSNRSRARKIQARAAAVHAQKKRARKAVATVSGKSRAPNAEHGDDNSRNAETSDSEHDDELDEDAHVQIVQLSVLAEDAASSGGSAATAAASFSALASNFSLVAFPAIPSLSSVDSTATSALTTADLFRAPNLAEVKLLEAPVRYLLERLRALLGEFSQHPILLQLVQLAQRLASLPVSTPLMKAVQGVELMLQKAEVRLSLFPVFFLFRLPDMCQCVFFSPAGVGSVCCAPCFDAPTTQTIIAFGCALAQD